jgi:putative sugar O-methyltransferase
MSEDGAFGSFSVRVGGREVSRDLLDSIAEIYFLERHLQISKRGGFRILDIGAGYGRLAYRASEAWPGLGGYLCTDAVASSTFLSEFYLKYRGLGDRARAVPLDEIEEVAGSGRIDLAVNIHSFSECQPATIEWWTRLIASNGVKHLMVVPNFADASGRRVLTNDRTDFTPILEKHGYRLIAAEPKFADPVVQQYGIYPAQYFLFELVS